MPMFAQREVLMIDQPADSSAPLSAEERGQLVEELGLLWERGGSPLIQGRILGHLIFTNADRVSTAELMSALQTSSGSVSTATRRLVEVGYIRRVAVPGERQHFFKVEDDLWGVWLASKRLCLSRAEQFAAYALGRLGSADTAPRRRLENMRDYHRWLLVRGHKLLLNGWERFKRQRDSAR
jgi:hypothetical protein